MPIWMRRNYIQLVEQAVDEQNKANDKSYQRENKKFAHGQQNSSTRIQRPDIKTSGPIISSNAKATRR